MQNDDDNNDNLRRWGIKVIILIIIKYFNEDDVHDRIYGKISALFCKKESIHFI